MRTFISENHRVAPEGKWLRDGGIEVPWTFNIYGPEIGYKNLFMKQ